MFEERYVRAQRCFLVLLFVVVGLVGVSPANRSRRCCAAPAVIYVECVDHTIVCAILWSFSRLAPPLEAALVALSACSVRGLLLRACERLRSRRRDFVSNTCVHMHGSRVMRFGKGTHPRASRGEGAGVSQRCQVLVSWKHGGPLWGHALLVL